MLLTRRKFEPRLDLLKVLRVPKVTGVNFGPYDNGHVLVGTADGKLLALDPISLLRVATY